MTADAALSRREFVQAGAAFGAGLLLTNADPARGEDKPPLPQRAPVTLPELLREGSLLVGGSLGFDLGTLLTPLRETIFGLLMVGFLILEPRGLAQLWKRARQKFSRGSA